MRRASETSSSAADRSMAPMSGTSSASPGRSASSSRSSSVAVPTLRTINSMPRPSSPARVIAAVSAGSAPKATAHTRRSPGASCLSSSSRLPRSSLVRLETPVRFPAGAEYDLTMPAASGSPTPVKTTGMVCVAAMAASVAASPLLKIRSTPDLTSALAAACRRSDWPSVTLTSKTTCSPSSKPSSRRPALRPSTLGWLAALASLSTPTR